MEGTLCSSCEAAGKKKITVGGFKVFYYVKPNIIETSFFHRGHAISANFVWNFVKLTFSDVIEATFVVRATGLK